MRHLFSIALIFILSTAIAQTGYKKLKNVPSIKSWTINFSEGEDMLQVAALKGEEVAPEVGMDVKAIKQDLDSRRKRTANTKTKTGIYNTSQTDITPEIGESFNGKPLGIRGTPNDNTMAVSNGGIVVSAVNSAVMMFNSDGTWLKSRTLAGITLNQLGLLNRTYDPKVLYDPEADRFILVFLQGSTSADTRIIVGFSQSNDPTQDWQFYAIDGRPLGGTTWSDYPIIAHNAKDLYITVNLLRDNESWQEGFVQSFIWQVNKEDGYNGDTLTKQLYYDIEYGGKSLWSICPVQPAKDFPEDEMYFLSVRPGAAANDSVFLHRISGNAESGQGEHQLTVLQTNKDYGVPPSAFQPQLGYRLQTNDTRVLSGTLLNNTIHYVQSTLIPDDLSSGIYHGVIRDVNSMPSASAEYINKEAQDLAYPSITYTGVENNDLHSMLITFSHSGEFHYPGTSVVFHNGLGSLDGLYSNVKVVKEGEGLINTFLPDSIERWGDYTDIQRKYNEPGVVWLCGSYGDSMNRVNIWLAKIVSKNELQLVDKIITFPNPASQYLQVAASFDKEELVDLSVVNISGQLLLELNDQSVKPGSLQFMVSTTGLAGGMYILRIRDKQGKILHSEKFIVKNIR